MTALQLRNLLRRLGLSEAATAKLVGASDGRTVRHWKAGTRAVPECVAILIKLLAAGKITAADIEAVR